MAHGSYFLQRISRERETASVGGDIEGEDAAVGAVFLYGGLAYFAIVSVGKTSNPFRSIVQSKNGLVNIDLVSEVVWKGRPRGDS